MSTLRSLSANHPPSKGGKLTDLPSNQPKVTADSVEVPKGLEEQVRVADQVFSKKKSAEKRSQVVDWSKWRLSRTEPSDYSFVSPKVDLTGIPAPRQKEVTARCLEMFKKANQALEYSVADAALSFTKRDLLPMVRELDDRYLALYEVYVEDHIRRGIPILPVDAGTLKNYGFTHEEVLKLTPHAKIFKETFQPLIGNDQQLRKAVLKRDTAEIIKLTSGDLQLQQKLLQEVQGYQKTLELMCDMDWKLSTFARYTPTEIDFYSECLVSYFDSMACKSPQEMIQALSQKSIQWNACFRSSFGVSDKKYRLQLELRHRVCGDGKAKLWESGNLGTSPFSLLALLKSDDHGGTNESVLRRRLYFLYRSNTLANEVMKEPGMAARLNCLLAERAVKKARKSNPFLQPKDIPQIRKEAAFLNIGLIDVLRERDPVKPLFQYGLYAYENERAKLRTLMSDSELEASQKRDPNPYMNEEANPSILNKRYRTELSAQERRVITGHSSSRSIADILDLELSVGVLNQNRTSFAESVEEYRIRTERFPWCSGRHVFKLDDQANSEYLKAVRELGLPTLAGISGTLDQSTTMAGIVSMGMDREELENLRLAYIAWMVSSDDHSLHEIMISGKTFGLPYTPRPNGYDDIAPSKPLFSQRVGIMQYKRGFFLPEQYLSNEYAKKVYQELA